MFHKLFAKKLAKEEAAHLIELEKEYIVSVCKPLAIFLFGSAARNEMTDASDLDFLVVLSDETDLKALKKQYYCSPRKRLWPVDIIFMDKTTFLQKSLIGGVAMICLQEGLLLYGGVNDQTR